MSADQPLAGRTLLVLAASVQQVPLIRRLRAMGARIVTLDNRPENPGHALAHVSRDADVRDISAVIAAAREEGVEGVVAAASDVALETAAELGAELGFVAPPRAATAALLSKTAFRAAQDAAGLPAPRWAPAGEPTPGPGPWIVKPWRGSGSRGVRIVEVEAELPAALAEAAAQSLDGQAMVEQMLAGSQHTAEGWIQGGQIAAMLVTDRLTAAPPHVATLGHRLPGSLGSDAQGVIRTDLERLFARLGYRDGPFDADVVFTDKGPVLIEVATRAGGNGLMCLVEAATGTDTMSLMGLHAVGLLPRLAPWKPVFAAVFILSDPVGGTLTYDKAAIPGLMSEPWVADLTLDLPSGAVVPPFTDGRSRFGQVVLTADSHAELDARLAEVRARLSLAVT